MERKELSRKDLEAIAAGQNIDVIITAGMMVLVYAVDLEAAGFSRAELAAQLGVDESSIQIR